MKFNLDNPFHNKFIIGILFLLAPIIISVLMCVIAFTLLIAWILLPFGRIRGNGKLGYVLEFPWAK